MRRLRKSGAAGLTTRELVELLVLFSSKMNESDLVATRLYDHFGTMSEIMEAPVAELTQIKGVSRSSALLFSMIPQISRRIQVDRAKGGNMEDMDALTEFVQKCFLGRTVEYFLLVCLDRNHRLLRYEFISMGTVNNSTVDLRKIMHIVLISGAAYVVVAHNHPRGNAFPSRDDLKTTQAIVNAFHKLDVKLLDHIIVSSRGTYSIAGAPHAVRCCMEPE